MVNRWSRFDKGDVIFFDYLAYAGRRRFITNQAINL
jgi:hypothetical protein